MRRRLSLGRGHGAAASVSLSNPTPPFYSVGSEREGTGFRTRTIGEVPGSSETRRGGRRKNSVLCVRWKKDGGLGERRVGWVGAAGGPSEEPPPLESIDTLPSKIGF